MSGENVEIVRRAFADFEHDMSEFLELLSDDLVTVRPGLSDPATYRGKEAYLEMTADWVEGFAEWSVTPEEYVDAGERVIVRIAQTGRGEGSGVPVEGLYWFVYTVRDGKIARLEMHTSEAQALEATGLQE
jgi:ketosteroid isomerase-like protein